MVYSVNSFSVVPGWSATISLPRCCCDLNAAFSLHFSLTNILEMSYFVLLLSLQEDIDLSVYCFVSCFMSVGKVEQPGHSTCGWQRLWSSTLPQHSWKRHWTAGRFYSHAGMTSCRFRFPFLFVWSFVWSVRLHYFLITCQTKRLLRKIVSESLLLELHCRIILLKYAA